MRELSEILADKKSNMNSRNIEHVFKNKTVKQNETFKMHHKIMKYNTEVKAHVNL